MAHMPESTPTRTIRHESWIEGETVTIQTWAGSAMQAAVQDALTEVAINPATMKPTSAKFTPGNATVVARVLAVKGWTLVYEDSRRAVPFTEENVRNVDPAYAAFIDAEIARDWKLWQTATGKAAGASPVEDARARKTFPQGVAAPAGGSDGADDAEAAPGDGDDDE